MKTHSVCRWSKAVLVLCGLLLVTSGLTLTATADDEESISPKLKRQIRLMETIIDEMLLDSPNLLVFSNSPTQGVYLGDYGVVFTLEASLVSHGFFLDGKEAFSILRDIRIDTEDGRVVIWSGEHEDDEKRESHRYRVRVRDGGDWDAVYENDDADRDDDVGGDEDDDADEDEDENAGYDEEDYDEDDWDDDDNEDIIIDFFGSKGKSFKELRREKAERAQENYEEGKQELIEVLTGYGDSMTRLADDQWVVIAAFLKQSDFFKDEEISRLILKARMRDLRDYGRERISADEMAARIVLEEY